MSRTLTNPLLLFCLFCANTETSKYLLTCCFLIQSGIIITLVLSSQKVDILANYIGEQWFCSKFGTENLVYVNDPVHARRAAENLKIYISSKPSSTYFS